jgi:hypothetical protein
MGRTSAASQAYIQMLTTWRIAVNWRSEFTLIEERLEACVRSCSLLFLEMAAPANREP